MDQLKKRQIVGWVAVGLSTAIACFWAAWGIIENFHEGWFHDSLPSNLGLMFVQYLSPMLIFVGLSLISIYFPRIGGITHAALGVLLPIFLRQFNFTVIVFITLPLVSLGLLYWLRRPRGPKWAAYVVIGLPLLTLTVCGVGPAIRIAGRVDDGNHQARLVDGNGVRLIWASDGLGWPRAGLNWYEATERCQYLAEDGHTSAAIPQNIWRAAGQAKPLPTPARWRGLIGEYGPDNDILIVLEKDGRLCALF